VFVVKKLWHKNSKLCTAINSLGKWFPTGVSRTPGGPKQDLRVPEMRFARVSICMFLDEVFFQKNMILMKAC